MYDGWVCTFTLFSTTVFPSTLSFSQALLYVGASLHLFFTNELTFAFIMMMPLFLVLIQHTISQIVPIGWLKAVLLLVVEVFFQWFAISAISEATVVISVVPVLGLQCSHFMMAPMVPYNMYVKATHQTKTVDEEGGRQSQVSLADSDDEGTIVSPLPSTAHFYPRDPVTKISAP